MRQVDYTENIKLLKAVYKIFTCDPYSNKMVFVYIYFPMLIKE